MIKRLCALSDIADGGSKSLGDDTSESLFAIRCGDEVFVYQNSCPHAGLPLNWMPDRFLTHDKAHIICTAHGALFDIATGSCLAGPCPGASLKSLPCRVSDGEVWLV